MTAAIRPHVLSSTRIAASYTAECQGADRLDAILDASYFCAIVHGVWKQAETHVAWHLRFNVLCLHSQ